MGTPVTATPAVLIYDGECAMCRASALWLMRLALSGGQLEILPCRSTPRRERFPGISDEACMTAMQLVLPGGRTLAGRAASPHPRARVARDGVRAPGRTSGGATRVRLDREESHAPVVRALARCFFLQQTTPLPH